jgi:ketosteroid isomerase-like protein
VTARSTAAIVAEYLAAIEARDLTRLRPLLHDDLVFIIPAALPGGGIYRGAQVLVDMIGSVDTVYRPETMVYERDPPLIDGNRAASRFTLSATTVLGRPYRNRYVILLRVEDGLVVEIDEHLDSLYAERVFRG